MRPIEEIVPANILTEILAAGYEIRVKKVKKGDYSPEFEQKVWKVYRHPPNCSKLKAYQAWERLTAPQKVQCIAALPIAVQGFASRPVDKIPHLSTWINGHYFETIAITAPVVQQNGAVVPKYDWPSIMRLYSMTSNWKQEHGPAPGEPGCLVPAEYLGEMMS